MNWRDCDVAGDIFFSQWQNQKIYMSNENSAISFDESGLINRLIRYDIFQTDHPFSQLITSDSRFAAKLRADREWSLVRSMMVPANECSITKILVVESAGPPTRHRFRPFDKKNPRDLSEWSKVDNLNTLVSQQKGSFEYFIDYMDSPDRYLISVDRDAVTPGWRRLYRFNAYPIRQYYILEGYFDGQTTCILTCGTSVVSTSGWYLIGSFFAFDMQIESSTRYAVYSRQDPFPRLHISTEGSFNAAGWTQSEVFYAFDVPLHGTTRYTLTGTVPQLCSQENYFARHHLSNHHYRIDWDFRLNIFVFPAAIDECCPN